MRRINQLSAAFRTKGLPVVFIQHTDSAEGLGKNTPEWEILPSLTRDPGDLTVEKSGCDSFLETPLAELLRSRGVDALVICGCATDFCVDTTVRSAGAHRFPTTVASDAHTTRDRPHLQADLIITHHNYIWSDFLLPGGRKIRVIPTASLLAELAG